MHPSITKDLPFQKSEVARIYLDDSDLSTMQQFLNQKVSALTEPFELFLTIESTQPPKQVYRLIDALSGHPKLIHLHFRMPCVRKHLSLSSFLVQGHALRVLDLEDSGITPQTLKEISSILAYDGILSALSFAKNKSAFKDNLDCLSQALLCNSKLQYLNVSYCGLSCKTLSPFLENVNRNPSSALEHLVVDGNSSVKEEQQRFWDAIASNQKLITIRADDFGSDDSCLLAIAKRIRKGFGFKVVSLSIDKTFDSSGLCSLFEALMEAEQNVIQGFEIISIKGIVFTNDCVKSVSRFIQSDAFDLMNDGCRGFFLERISCNAILGSIQTLDFSNTLKKNSWHFSTSIAEEQSHIEKRNAIEPEDMIIALEIVKKRDKPLKFISFRDIPFTNSRQSITDIISISSQTIEGLDLCNCRLDASLLSELFSTLSSLANLSALDLSWNSFLNFNDYETSIDFSSFLNLQSLNLSFCNLNDHSGPILARQLRLMNITHLNLLNCRLGRKSFSRLCKFIQSSHSIRMVNLGNSENASESTSNYFQGKECGNNLVRTMATNTSLKEVYIRNAAISVESTRLIDAISTNSRLEVFHCDIKDEKNDIHIPSKVIQRFREGILYSCEGFSTSGLEDCFRKNRIKCKRLVLLSFIYKHSLRSFGHSFDKNIFPLMLSFMD